MPQRLPICEHHLAMRLVTLLTVGAIILHGACRKETLADPVFFKGRLVHGCAKNPLAAWVLHAGDAYDTTDRDGRFAFATSLEPGHEILYVTGGPLASPGARDSLLFWVSFAAPSSQEKPIDAGTFFPQDSRDVRVTSTLRLSISARLQGADSLFVGIQKDSVQVFSPVPAQALVTLYAGNALFANRHPDSARAVYATSRLRYDSSFQAGYRSAESVYVPLAVCDGGPAADRSLQ